MDKVLTGAAVDLAALRESARAGLWSIIGSMKAVGPKVRPPRPRALPAQSGPPHATDTCRASGHWCWIAQSWARSVSSLTTRRVPAHVRMTKMTCANHPRSQAMRERGVDAIHVLDQMDVPATAEARRECERRESVRACDSGGAARRACSTWCGPACG